MTENEILAGFEDLFGSTEEPTEETEVDTEPGDDEVEDQTEEQEEESIEESETEPEDKPSDDKHKAKQNFEFARLRTENKKQATLIKNLGKVIGMDSKASVEDIMNQVQDLVLQKEAKDTNVPVEVLQRMQELESIAAENQRIKLETDVQKALNNLAEKYAVSSDDLVKFVTHLSENNKNPLDGVQVDLEAEYLKLNHDLLVKAAVESALADEAKRKEHVDQHAGSRVPGNADDSDSEGTKINTVADLDKFFSGLEI